MDSNYLGSGAPHGRSRSIPIVGVCSPGIGLTSIGTRTSGGAERTTSATSTCWPEDFRVKTSAQQARELALMALEAAYGGSSTASQASLPLNGSSSKMSQAGPSAGLMPSVGAWDSSDTRRYRSRLRRRMLEHRTCGGGFLLLPTPSACSYGSNRGGAAGRVGPVRHSLQSLARSGMLPTPTAGDAKASGSRRKAGSSAKPGVSLTDVVVHGQSLHEHHERTKGGHLSPRFVEWLMGVPQGWTEPG